MNHRQLGQLLLRLSPAFAALLPLIWCQRSFRELFFFGDDWEHISRIEMQGLWNYSWAVFAENWVPVFKFAWGSLLIAGGGSHFVIVAALWLTHAAVVLLADRMLDRAGAGWITRFGACLVIALSSTNIETLGWTTQWTTVMSAAFTLAAIGWFIRSEPLTAAWSFRVHGVLVLLVAGSACSVSRGVLAGLVLVPLCLWPAAGPARSWGRRVGVAALVAIPCLVPIVMIATFSSGNHRAMADHLGEMVRFGSWYFAVNPLHRLLAVDSFGWRTTTLLGLLKVAVVVWALWRSHGPLRIVFALLTLIDLGGAALVGIGRYHTGLGAITSSRYQYLPLVSFMPLAAFAAEEILRRLVSRPAIRNAIAVAGIAAAAVLVAMDWPREMQRWAHWRGREARELVSDRSTPPPDRGLPGIPGISVDRGRELTDRFDLH